MQQWIFTFLTTLFFQNLEENGLMFRTLYIVKLDHPGFFFCHLYLRTLQFFLDVFCMDLVKERMLCTLLHCISILLKCEMKGLYTETNASESTR